MHGRRLEKDTAWMPVSEKEFESWGPVRKTLFTFFMGTPLKNWASVGHWMVHHFFPKDFNEEQRTRVCSSSFSVFATGSKRGEVVEVRERAGE
jgi:acyl-lipid omega-6 desaturase (Delta-12 desaturase)